MNITKATATGRRDYQEDRFFVSRQKSGTLIAVMDGHGGDKVAQRIAQFLPAMWRKYHVANAKTTILSIFHELNLLTRHEEEGSTTSVVFIPEGSTTVHAAVLGDSPIIIQGVEGKLNVGPMHNARSNPAELQAAKEKGARFDGNYIHAGPFSGGIQMTRSFGDRDFENILNRSPQYYTVECDKSSFILIGSDGLFDPSHFKVEEEITAVVDQIRLGADAENLVKRAVMIPTEDNVTAILVRFGNKKARRKTVPRKKPASK